MRISPPPAPSGANLGPYIPVLRTHLRQSGRHVQFRDRTRRRPNPLRVIGGLLAGFVEDPLLDFENLLIGRQHLAFVLFQLSGGESLRVYQCLFTFVIGRREMPVRVRNFDVITEDVVEADLQRADAGPHALAPFYPEQYTDARSG